MVDLFEYFCSCFLVIMSLHFYLDSILALLQPFFPHFFTLSTLFCASDIMHFKKIALIIHKVYKKGGDFNASCVTFFAIIALWEIYGNVDQQLTTHFSAIFSVKESNTFWIFIGTMPVEDSTSRYINYCICRSFFSGWTTFQHFDAFQLFQQISLLVLDNFSFVC